MIRCNQIFYWPCDECMWLKAVGPEEVIRGVPSKAKWVHSNEISRRGDYGFRKIYLDSICMARSRPSMVIGYMRSLIN